eukprot:m51a1_g13765 putative vacuolar protein sorting-associated protein 18 homolog (977) ;mRNA; r:253137-257178
MALVPDDDMRSYGAPLSYEEELPAEEAPAAVAAGPAPIFQLTHVSSPRGLIHMAVADGIVIMAVARCHVVRLDTKNPQGVEDIEIPTRDSIHKVFVDPTGHHVLVSTRAEENFYLHSTFKKPKALSRMRGCVVESVAWCTQNRDASATQEVLVGTTQGRIYETSFDIATERKFVELAGVGVGGKDQTWKQLYELGGPVSGLRYERFTPTGTDPNRYFVMATTATQLYQFIGGPTFEQMMAYYEEKPSIYAESPPGATTASQLEFFCPYGAMPQKFAWLTGPGVLHGTLSFGSQFPGDSVAQENDWLMYSSYPQLGSSPVVSLAMTEFHYLVLCEGTLLAVNSLTKEVAFEFDLGPNSRVKGLCKDPVTGVVRLFCEGAIYDLVVTDEDRDVWRQYMERRDWDTAIRYCKDDAEKRDKVYTYRADYYFGEGKYELAAQSYAQSAVPFEEVCLKFINKDKRDALMSYLLKKLDMIPADMHTQVTLVCTWLVEIYLNKLNVLKDSGAAEMYAEMEKEFHEFLAQRRESLNPATTFNLISSHGRIDDLLFYANATEDYARVISHYIQRQAYKEAIVALSKLKDQSHEELFYKFSPMLMYEMPEDMVKCWMHVGFLNPKRLFPALMRYDPAKNNVPGSENQAIKYLQYCVNVRGNKEAAIHNFLLSLYAQQDDDHALTEFIQSAESIYDDKYALRLCTKMGKWHACVLIYSKMGLYDEAVDLALKVDLELAKSTANSADIDDEGTRKRLWLKIAQHVVKDRRDIKEAVRFLRECELLKIEDILPFFPDFTRIDDFKDEICRSLDEYSHQIDDLKAEMEVATRSAEATRRDIAALRSKCGIVRARQPCGLCALPVLTRRFYYFPCAHAFHADCLVAEMRAHLTSSENARVDELLSRAAESAESESPADRKGAEGAAVAGSGAEGEMSLEVSKAEAVRSELDALVASQCVLCSDLMVKQVDQPFIAAGEEDVVAMWAIPTTVM